jgi:hypothetical protein
MINIQPQLLQLSKSFYGLEIGFWNSSFVLEKYSEWFFEDIVLDSVKKQNIIGSYSGTGLFI